MNKQAGVALLAMLGIADGAAAAVTDHKTWSQSYPVTTQAPRLLIDNIWGNVRVRVGATREIAVTVDEKRSAPSQELFELSKQTIVLDVKADSDGLAMIVGKSADAAERWVDRCRGCRVDYQFEVTVPPGTQIDVSTVTDGGIEVVGGGAVSASNVNGPVSVQGLQDCAEIESVNGEIEVSFARAPSRDCRIKTINGDITLSVPRGTSLDAALNMMQGKVVSELDLEPLELPAKVEQRNDGGRFVYRVEQAAGIRLGSGGPTFTIESLNGDLRIRRSN